MSVVSSNVFFFQAEDGIRDLTVTGVQTCALPICLRLLRRHDSLDARAPASLHWARFQYRLESKTRMGRNAQPDPYRCAQLDGHQHCRVSRPGTGSRYGETIEALRIRDHFRAATR